MSAAVTVTGPGNFAQAVTATAVLTRLLPGVYTVVAGEAGSGDDAYAPGPPRLDVLVAAGGTAPAAVDYALVTGALALDVSGLPPGATAAITVIGPGEFSREVTGPDTLTGLRRGAYSVMAVAVAADRNTWAPIDTLALVGVSAGPVPARAEVRYRIRTGAVLAQVEGLPEGATGAITASGPGNEEFPVQPGEAVTNLMPGRYTLTGSAVAVDGDVFEAPSPDTVTIEPSETPVMARVRYRLATGGLRVTVSGLPDGVTAAVTVAGPGGYSQAVSGTALLAGLVPGTYTVSASLRQEGIGWWSPSPASQNVTVSASVNPHTAAVAYASAAGTLQVNVSGLPAGGGASVIVSGPAGYSRAVSGTTTLAGLLQGAYTISAAAITAAGSAYSAAPPTQVAAVSAGATSTAFVSYAPSAPPPPPPPPPPPSLNLAIDGLHIQQVVQSYGGAVPLVAGRDGLVRVFVKANGANTAAPTVRVRFYDGTTLKSTITINAPGPSVPAAVSEGLLGSSWNYPVPRSLLQPGLRVLADVDPANSVAESSDADNTFPASGTPAALDVRSVPGLDVRLVPVTQSANGYTGNVTAANAPQFLAFTRRIYPLGSVSSEVRAPFTTSAPVLRNDDGNGAWSQILSELNALRAADGSSRYYVGVVKAGYSSGVAGLGYVPGRTTLTWDHLPSADDVVAHELGHNFGRFHAPGCGAGGPDPAYPYAGAAIGVFGFDLAAGALKPPTTSYDLMSYCSNDWISDYTYNAVMASRGTTALVAGAMLAAGRSPRRGLLVWGRIERGQVTLEPAYEVTAAPLLPARPGPHRLQAFGPLGEALADFTFAGERTTDAPGDAGEHFAFVIPFDALQGIDPSRLRVTSGPRQAERGGGPITPRRPASPVVARAGAGAVRVRWTDPAIRGVLVRDAASGEILSFASGGDVLVHTRGREVDLTLSDGVASTRERVRVRD